MRLTCLLIGQDNLLIQCGKYLLEKKHEIKWVVSQVQSIQSWCDEHHIPWVPSLKDLPEYKEQSVDYLFSIVNGKILSKEDLKIARCAAINYHDSLLPKYAGVHATTWSILNGETIHGITWHLINEGIDEGDIVYQGQFPIAANETALTLNLRCFEEAVKGFADLIGKIETATLTTQKQRNDNRSYFGLNHVLPNMGLINWKTADAHSILSFNRALNFGNYSNNVGLLKIYLKDSFLIVLDVELTVQKNSTQQGGLVLSLGKDGLLISTTTQPILIKQLITTDGKTVTADDLTQTYGIGLNSQLPFIEESLIQNNSPTYKKALSHEKYWITQLIHIKEHSFFSDRMRDLNHEYDILPSIDMKQYKAQNVVYLLTSVMVYLYRINNYEPFSIFWQTPTLSTDCAPLFSQLLPISAHEFQSHFKVQHILELINHQLELVKKHDTFLSDVFIRQPSLASIAHDTKECLITAGLNQDNRELWSNSLIHFEINPDKGELTIYHRLNQDYQGGTLTPVIENMTDHLSNILQVLINEPDTLINQFSFLSEKERKQLFSWSVGESLPLPSNTITDLFEQQVKYSPERLALCEENHQLTYHQLWIEAEKITALLQKFNVEPKSLFAISTAPSAKMLALILGILKAGCIFVLFDPERLNVTLEEYSNKINQKIYDAEELLDRQFIDATGLTCQPNLSKPKELCMMFIDEEQECNFKNLNQKQLINYSYWLAHNNDFDSDSILQLTSSIPLDLMGASLLSPLLVGGTLNLSTV